MDELFVTICNMSITAGWLTLAVILLRFLLKKAPKWIMGVLWSMVAVRLLCPFSVESIFSLLPSGETLPQDIVYTQVPQINSGIPIINHRLNPVIGGSLSPNPGDSVNPMQVIMTVAAFVWIIGMVALLIYTLVSYLIIRHRVREAVRLPDEKEKGSVWLCDGIASPFILGMVRPRIYLPSNLSEEDIPYVLAHERAHLRRRDHWWKPLGFLLLTVYWFNPLLWVAYILFCRDIELACDEKVIKALGLDTKKPYAEVLVRCRVSRKRLTACPLAFGEVGVKERIKRVLHYKKPALWILIAALVVCTVTAVCFLTDPMERGNEEGRSDIFNQKAPWADIGAAKSLQNDMTYEEVVALLGSEGLAESPDNDIYVWRLTDKEVLYVWFSITDGWRKEKRVVNFATVGTSDANVLFTITPQEPIGSLKEADLRENYPQYFDLNTSKGIEVYVWPTEKGTYVCGALRGTNRNKTEEEIRGLVGISFAEMEVILSTYHLPADDCTVMLLSSDYRFIFAGRSRAIRSAYELIQQRLGLIKLLATESEIVETGSDGYPIADAAAAKQITEGMTLGEVIHTLGCNGVDVGSGNILRRWTLSDGTTLSIWFIASETDDPITSFNDLECVHKIFIE